MWGIWWFLFWVFLLGKSVRQCQRCLYFHMLGYRMAQVACAEFLTLQKICSKKSLGRKIGVKEREAGGRWSKCS